MVTMNMYKKIKNCKNMKMSIRQTAKKWGFSRKTVSKYYKMDTEMYVEYLTTLEEKTKRFDPYKDEVIEIYLRNEGKVYKSSVYDVLEEKYGSLPGSERTLRNYVSYLYETGQIKEDSNIRLYTPVEGLPFGKQLQLDFGEIKIATGEKVYIFATVLSASRFRYVAVQPTPFKTIDIIRHLLDCFEYIGGIPREIVIDQDRALVVSENFGDIILTQKFKDFRDEMGFSLYVCRKADPESKGKVENLVKFVKTSFFSGRRFNSFDEIPPRLDEWLERRANGKICQSTGVIPRNLLQREQEKLSPLVPSLFNRDYILERESRKVSEKSMISLKGSQYSVPREYRNRTVWLSLNDKELILYNSIDGYEIARHNLSLIPGEKVINKHHLRNFSIKANELKRELLQKKDNPLWQEFVEANYKHLTRYFRDQHALIIRFLEKDRRDAIMIKALQFCLDSEKYSARDLKEAYEYFEVVENEKQPDILPSLLTGVMRIREDSPDLKVQKRKLSYYTSLVSLLGGAL
jgi:transposase